MNRCFPSQVVLYRVRKLPLIFETNRFPCTDNKAQLHPLYQSTLLFITLSTAKHCRHAISLVTQICIRQQLRVTDFLAQMPTPCSRIHVNAMLCHSYFLIFSWGIYVLIQFGFFQLFFQLLSIYSCFFKHVMLGISSAHEPVTHRF